MIKRQLWIISILCGLFFLPANAAPLQLTNIQITAQNNVTRVLLTLNNSSDYHVFTLQHPDRLVVDFSSAQLATSLRSLTLSGTPFLHVREGHPKPGMLRLVFELNQTLAPKAIDVSRTTNKDNEQLMIALTSNNSPPADKTTENTALQQTQQWTQENLTQTKTVQSTPSPEKSPDVTPAKKVVISQPPITTKEPTANNEPENIKETTVAPPPLLASRPIMIVIDPGHGGKDPGTMGPNGIKEKNVVLAISRDLYQLLQKEPGYHAALTRTSDYFIPLRGRLAIARQDKGDMFIAIHADAYNEPGATGAAIFALSQHGASSEAARWLAEKENYSELGGVTLSDKSDMLRSVLIDLSQTATISSSMQLGSTLLPQLAKVGRLHYSHVEQAPFMVLKSPDIPSLLVETGFLSNPIEERRLSDSIYQQKIAQALFVGIKNYFWNNPPPGTLVASLKQSKKLS